MSKKKLTCVDLFSGAGGFSLAARNVGVSVVAAVERGRHQCETYRHNLITEGGGTTLYEGDILELCPEVLRETHFSDGSDCDIVLGGPPCQGFSVHRIRSAGVGDPRNALILRYFEFVNALRPKVFLMENVPGILWERHKSFLDNFYEQGKSAGYTVMPPVILDARDFGIPQRRKRVFILGVRNDFSFNTQWPPYPTHGDELARNKNPILLPWVNSEVVFNKEKKANDKNDIHMNHTPALIEVFKSTPQNGGSRRDSNRVLPCHNGHHGHTDVYGRISLKEPAPTMTTACINPSKGRFVHPIKHHGITVREAARFQTFPEWFEFQGGIISSGEQIGNAVPVKLGEVLLSTLAEGLKNGVALEVSNINKEVIHG